MSNCCTNIPVENAWEMSKILPTIISTIIVITIFIIGRILDGEIKSKEIRRNWYQNIIINPNINKLELFYTDILNAINNSTDILIQSKSRISFEEYLSLKSTEIGKFQSIKRNFEFEFIFLVQTNFPEIAEELSEHIRKIEDKVTIYIDDENISIDKQDNFNSEIKVLKNEIFGILYKPLAFKKYSFRQYLSDKLFS